MKIGKAIFCTAAITGMMILILVGLLLLRYTLAFFVIAGIFAALGLGLSSGQLFRWLASEADEDCEPEIPAVFSEDEAQVRGDCKIALYSETVDDIIKEVRGE